MENAASYSSFAEQLRSFRKRRRLTQQGVAEQLNVSRGTIVGWESNRTHPQSKGLVLDLAKVLRLDEQDTRLLLEASFTTPAPRWYVPYPRNPLFTGREKILGVLYRSLATEQRIAFTQSCALSGLGGTGKTQVALEYAYRHALDHSAIFWISAETPEQMTASFVAIAEVLRLPERQEADQQRIREAVKSWLNAHSGWLLIWDNLEEWEILSSFFSGLQPGAHLITTRAQALGALAQSLEVQPLAPEVALLFLLRRTKRLPPPSTLKQLSLVAEQMPVEYEAAKSLVGVLGGLPLALDQAGAYIEETGCGLQGYLERYREQRGLLLAHRGSPSVLHPQSVMTTFTLACQHLEAEPEAAALLRVCAFLSAETIPEELFAQPLAHLGAALENLAGNPVALDLALAALRRLSLVQRQPETRAFSLHRLVQAVQQEQFSEGDQRQWAEQAVRLVAAAFPNSKEFSTWQRCQRLLPHALVCVGHIERWGFAFPEAVSLLNTTGYYLRQRGQYQEARPLFEHALSLGEQTLGPNHPEVAQSLNNLAVILWHHDGYIHEALPILQRTLAIREQAFGPNHILVAQSLNNLALLLNDLGCLEEATKLYQRAISIFEQVLGPDHPDVATGLNNLGDLFHSRNLDEQALALLQRAYTIRRQALGLDHPDVAISLSSMSAIYRDRGQIAEVVHLLEQALAIRERALGPDHPDVAESLNNLSELYLSRGQDEKAAFYYQRARGIRQQTMGPSHPLLVAQESETLADLAPPQAMQDPTPLPLSFQHMLAEVKQSLGEN